MNNTYTIRGIIQRCFRQYAVAHRLRADVLNAAHRIMNCRTAAMGGHVERCECGHIATIRYNSCRHRCCPECSGGRRAQWLERLSQELLPCDHVHVIFTLPEELNRVWQFNRKLFADLLMQAAREALQTLLSDAKYLGATPGIISALHTWGRNLSVHPHVHCLVTAGGLHRDGTLVMQKRSTLLPARVLMSVFRGKLRAFLKAALDTGELEVPTGLAVARLHSLLNRLGRIDWNVRIQERYRHGVSVAGYLARYVTGGPISDRRIESVQNGQVIFRYRDHRDGNEKHMSLSVNEFLARWFEHVPPRGLRMIRRSGLYANSHKETRRRLRAVATDPASPSVRPVNTLEPEYCPRCNTPVVRRDSRLCGISHPPDHVLPADPRTLYERAPTQPP